MRPPRLHQKQPSYGKADGKVEYCSGHAGDRMVDVVNNRCTQHNSFLSCSM